MTIDASETHRSMLLAYIKRRWKIIRSYIGWEDYLTLIAILIGALGYIPGPIPSTQGWTVFYHDIRSDLIALGLTVLIIDNVNEMYRRRAEKERLILQMGSPEHVPAIEAARQLGVREWLFDGSLSGANLRGANLRRVDLRGADLSGIDLSWANLSWPSLSGANLDGTKLDQARYDHKTKWPEWPIGFDPLAAGAILIESDES